MSWNLTLKEIQAFILSLFWVSVCLSLFLSVDIKVCGNRAFHLMLNELKVKQTDWKLFIRPNYYL